MSVSCAHINFINNVLPTNTNTSFKMKIKYVCIIFGLSVQTNTNTSFKMKIKICLYHIWFECALHINAEINWN